MVEYSDVFDEVDEFQKKAKVTINQDGSNTLVNLVDVCARPSIQAGLVLM